MEQVVYLASLNKTFKLPPSTLSIRIKKLNFIKFKKEEGLAEALKKVKNIKYKIESERKILIDWSCPKTKTFFECLSTEQYKQLLKLSYFR